jgi:hypothetical protein
MDVHVRELAAAQADLLAVWQLFAVGWTRAMIDHRVRSRAWRVVHPGVYALTNAPLTRRQRWIAATLTTPDSVLSHASAAACSGFRPWEGAFETVTRPGSGGRMRRPGLLVMRSRTLDGDTTHHMGIPMTTCERTLIDLAAHLSGKEIARAFREVLRLKLTEPGRLLAALARHRGRPGTRILVELATRYAHLPYSRTRSNPEGRALEVLHDAEIDAPKLNFRVAGEEADLVWPKRRLIIEIDGPQYHQFQGEDARKQRRWEDAGYTVRRIPSDAVYEQPDELIALAPGSRSA